MQDHRPVMHEKVKMNYSAQIASDLKLKETSVARTVELLDGEATVPFIARYRKEVTGSLDEVQIAAIRDRLEYLRDLENRKETILRQLEKIGRLTDELREKIEATLSATELEDIYLPYKPKRKTRATEAIAKGLEPLADLIWAQEPFDGDLAAKAAEFVDAEKGVPDVEAAWAGARDICAERVAEHAEVRAAIRNLFLNSGTVGAQVKKDKQKTADAAKFKNYFDFSEGAATIPSHRMLAIRRGEAEGVLTFRITADRDAALKEIRRHVLREGDSPLRQHLATAIDDGYDRLLAASIEGQVRNELRKRADEEAIHVFAKNLRGLLMASPLGNRWVLGVDPGMRTGCKIVALDGKGDLLASTTIFPFRGDHEQEKAKKIVEDYCQRYRIEAVAIGNGTGGRETETFLRKMDRDQLNDAQIVMISEAGASVYSASETARREFPDLDVSVRGAISIGRRMQDPLAELVKIEPKSIGVGQYQHDVDQPALKKSLDDVVVSCVNAVGVELNTASAQLLSYVSGLNSGQAQAIVSFRAKNGPFRNRKQLLDVSKLGPKTFEQAAGFLRIRTGENPLDASAVHPERYSLVEQMAADLDTDVPSLMTDSELRKRIDIAKYVSEEVGEPTLKDILAELAKPGRDPRDEFKSVAFDPDVTELAHLQEGQILEGVVTNVTDFGAFVDIGVHQDGLVHVSELSHQFINDPTKVVEVGQHTKVKVIGVDRERKRISLSIKQTTPAPPAPAKQPPARGNRPPRDAKKFPPREGGKKFPPRERQQQQPREPQRRGVASDNPFAVLYMENGQIKMRDDKKKNRPSNKK